MKSKQYYVYKLKFIQNFCSFFIILSRVHFPLTSAIFIMLLAFLHDQSAITTIAPSHLVRPTVSHLNDY